MGIDGKNFGGTKGVFIGGIIIVAIALLAFGAPQAYAVGAATDNATGDVEVWVDTNNGSDSNSGIEISPFATIGKGINSVSSGGTVHVEDGEYTETLTINKSLTIKAADGANPVVAAGGVAIAIKVSSGLGGSDSSPAVVIDGLTVKNWVEAGIVSKSDTVIDALNNVVEAPVSGETYDRGNTADPTSIQVQGDNSEIKGNEVEVSNSEPVSSWTKGVDRGSDPIGILVEGGPVKVSDNEVYSVDENGNELGVGIRVLGASSNDVVVDNTVEDLKVGIQVLGGVENADIPSNGFSIYADADAAKDGTGVLIGHTGDDLNLYNNHMTLGSLAHKTAILVDDADADEPDAVGTIKNNVLVEHEKNPNGMDVGVQLEHAASGWKIKGNTISGPNEVGIVVAGGTATISDNTLNGIEDDHNEVALGTEGNTVQGNRIRGFEGSIIPEPGELTASPEGERVAPPIGIVVVADDQTIEGNRIVNNFVGVFLVDAGYGKHTVINQNRIYDNVVGLVVGLGNNSLPADEPNVDATRNFWGSETGPSGGAKDPITGAVANGSGDEIDAPHNNVRFDPWLPLQGDPTATFTYCPSEPKVGKEVTFEANDSTDPGGNIEIYQWSFGDDTSATGEEVTHKYTEKGKYTVELTVTDNDGNTDTASAELELTYEREYVQVQNSGWSMVSAPLKPANNAPAKVFTGVNPSTIFHYDAGKGDYITPSGNYDKVMAFHGTWISLGESEAPKVFTIPGVYSGDVTITLEHAGWHQVGLPLDYGWSDIGVTKEGEDTMTIAAQASGPASPHWMSRFIWDYETDNEAYTAYDASSENTFNLKPGKAYWVKTYEKNVKLVIPYNSPPPTPTAADTQAKGVSMDSARAEKLDLPQPPTPPETYSVGQFDIQVTPNPVTNNDQVTFIAAGSDVQSFRVRVYNSAGKQIHVSRRQSDHTYSWQPEGNLSNGLYLYQVTARKDTGKTIAETGKLLVLR